jgi:hypothetical protein
MVTGFTSTVTHARHHSAKLTADAVRHIRESREMGKVLAIDYGVSRATISLIRRGERWKWLRRRSV